MKHLTAWSRIVQSLRCSRRIRSHRLAKPGIESLENRQLLSAVSGIVEDLNTTVQSAELTNSRQFTELLDKVYFVAEHPAVGTEIWETNPSTGNTRLISELAPGAISLEVTDMTAWAGRLYLHGGSGTFGSRFWQSDGMPGGTREVEFAPEDEFNYVSSPFLISDGRLYFVALVGNGAQIRNHLYRIEADITSAPERFSDISLENYDNERTDWLTVSGDYFFMKGYLNTSPVMFSIHRTTGIVNQLPISGGRVLPLGDSILIVRSQWNGNTFAADLWMSDGTSGGTKPLTDLSQSITGFLYAESVASDGNHVWLITQDSFSLRLWRTDGSLSGTESFSMPEAIGYDPFEGQVAAGRYYALVRQSPSDFLQLWVSDGTQSGTKIVSDEVHWPHTLESALLPLSDGLAVAAPSEAFSGVWFTNGDPTSNRMLIPVSYVDVSGFWNVSTVRDEIYLSTRPQHSVQTTLGGTREAHTESFRIEALSNASSSPKFFYSDESSGTALFTATTADGPGIWRTDGTAAGTHRLPLTWSLLSGTELVSAPRAIGTADGHVLLSLTGTEFTELWMLHPVVGAETLLQRFLHSSIKPEHLFSWGTGALMTVRTTDAIQIYAAMGHGAATSSILTVPSVGSEDGLIGVSPINDTHFIYMTRTAGNRRALWISDISGIRPRLLRTFESPDDPAIPFVLNRVGNQVVFSADDGSSGNEMWVTDGTSAGTRLLIDIAPGNLHSIHSDTKGTDRKLYFVATDGTGTQHWWVTDGTSDGTHRIVESNEQERVSGNEAVAATGDKFFIMRPHQTYGSEVLSFNGDSIIPVARFNRLNEGTILAYDLFFAAYDRLYFVVHSKTEGAQLWATDGTEAGTNSVLSSSEFPLPEDQSSEPDMQVFWGHAAGGLLYSGWMEQTGFEPVLVRPDGASDAVTQLRVEAAGERTLLKWNPVAGADGYVVELTVLNRPDISPTVRRVSGASLLVPEGLRDRPLQVRIRGQLGSLSSGPWSDTFNVLTGFQPVIDPLNRADNRTSPLIHWHLPAGFTESELWISDRDRNQRIVHLTDLDVTSHQTVGLQPGRYAVWVRATSPLEQSSWSQTMTFEVLAESPVLSIAMSDSQARSRQLTWTTIEDAFGYELQLRQVDSGNTLVRNLIVGPMATSWTTPALPGGEYEAIVRVRAPGRAGSEWSNAVRFVVREAPRISVSSNAARLAWPAVAAATGYKVQVLNIVTGVTEFSTSTTGTTVNLPVGVPPGRFRADVQSVYADASTSDWTSLRFERFGAAVTPILESAATVDATPTISWNRTASAIGYEVIIQLRGSNTTAYRAGLVTTTSHRVQMPLAPGDYTVWVRAYFPNGGRSLWGSGVTFSIGAAPALRNTRTLLEWNAVPGATRYEVHVNYRVSETDVESRFLVQSVFNQTSLQLAPLPHGIYRVWLRAIRAEAGQVYYSRWSDPLVIRISG